MKCCQCQGIEALFDNSIAAAELKRYRKKGPVKTTQILLDAIKDNGLARMSLLDIGGGVGVIQHELIKAGIERAMDVEASTAYIESSKDEAHRHGWAERAEHHHGDFVELADEIPAADIVTLDRVICCYHDMPAQVKTSVNKARKLYGLVYPRENWWTKLAFAIQNLLLWFRRNPFRMFIHSTDAVHSMVCSSGFRQRFFRKTLFWQIVVYERSTE